MKLILKFGTYKYKINVSKKWSIGLEWTWRSAQTDYLDDVSTVYIDPTLLETEASEWSNPSGIDIKSKNDTVNFFPYMLVKDTVAVCVFGVIISAVIFFGPNLMSEVDNYIPADPLVTPAHIVPNWYLAPFYAILRAVPDKLGGVLLMFAAIIVLFVIPWLDT